MNNTELISILVYTIKAEYENYSGYCCKNNYSAEEFIKVLYTLIKDYQ